MEKGVCHYDTPRMRIVLKEIQNVTKLLQWEIQNVTKLLQWEMHHPTRGQAPVY
jgi:hypothetical protein